MNQICVRTQLPSAKIATSHHEWHFKTQISVAYSACAAQTSSALVCGFTSCVCLLLKARKEKPPEDKVLGRIFLGHQGPRCRDIPDKNFMQASFFCCFRHSSLEVQEAEQILQQGKGWQFIYKTSVNFKPVVWSDWPPVVERDMEGQTQDGKPTLNNKGKFALHIGHDIENNTSRLLLV